MHADRATRWVDVVFWNIRIRTLVETNRVQHIGTVHEHRRLIFAAGFFEVQYCLPKRQDRLNVRSNYDEMGATNFFRLALELQIVDELVEFLSKFGIALSETSDVVASYSHANRVVTDVEVRLLIHLFSYIGEPVNDFNRTFKIIGTTTNFQAAVHDGPAE